MAQVPYISSILGFTEDMKQENIISMCLYQITEYLKQNLSEVSANYHSSLLKTLAGDVLYGNKTS